MMNLRVLVSKALLAVSAGLAGLVVVCGSLGSAAHAAPLVYNFVAGSAVISASTASNPVLGSTTVALDGSFMLFDDAPVGPLDGDLVDFLVTSSNSGLITLSAPWGGNNSFTIESASLSPGGGYSTTAGVLTAPFTYEIDSGPVDIDAIFNVGGPSLPISATAPVFSATVQTNTVVFNALGITLFEIPGASFGEQDDLVVKADIMWFGQVVPEPSTGLLLGMGLIGVATRGRWGRGA